MTPAQVVIIVVNWKLKNDTLRCLKSLEGLDLPDAISHRVIVVDNGSGDGSAKCIADAYPESELISLSTNVGFGAACNVAIRQIMWDGDDDYVFLLNNDASVHPKVLAELVQAAEAHPEAGILGPKIYYQDDPRTIWYAGARKRWGVLAAVDTGRGQVDRGQFGARREVDYVFGAGMLIRCSVFERIGLFDERFFLYLEDMDFCLRAQAAGFSLLFVPQAHVWHKGAASTANHNGFRKYHFVRSTIHFARKHNTWAMMPYTAAFWALVLLRFVVVDLTRGNLSAVRSYWSGLVNGFTEVRRV